MLGQEGTEGLGFSTDAAPPWIASAPFRVDKTGGTEVAKIIRVTHVTLRKRVDQSWV